MFVVILIFHIAKRSTNWESFQKLSPLIESALRSKPDIKMENTK